MVDTSDEWIVTRTGIRERRIAGLDETVATMGFQAAEKALEMAGIDKDDIGLIIVATTSSSHAFPSSACQVQRMLGIKDAASFDLAAACAGFTYALSVADQYVKSGAVKHAIVIGSDVLSRALIQKIVVRSFCLAMALARWYLVHLSNQVLCLRIYMLMVVMASCSLYRIQTVSRTNLPTSRWQAMKF